MIRRLAVALLLVVGVAQAAPAAPAPPRSASGTLAGVTSITWTGNVGFRLRVPRLAELPDAYASTRVFLTGGTYAFVRMYPVGLCDDARHCVVETLTYTRELADSAFFGPQSLGYLGPGSDHFRSLGTPPSISGLPYELYLMTDGRATVEFRPKGFAGRTAYTATGRISAHVERLAPKCTVALPACDTTHGYADAVRFGGTAHDVGRDGYAESYVYSADRNERLAPGIPKGQPHTARPCVYPSMFDRAASPRAEDHPLGCDLGGSDVDGVSEAALHTSMEVANSANVIGAGYCTSLMNVEASGPTYVGYRIPSAAGIRYRTAYGIWFTWGIR
jgi:hypothetical protein